MPRPKRHIQPGHHYLLTVKSSQSQTIFRDEEDYRKYLSLIDEAAAKTKTKVINHVLMPNGALFVIQPQAAEIASFLRITQLSYARYYCRKYGVSGHVWQAHAPCRHIAPGFLDAYAAFIRNHPIQSDLVPHAQKATVEQAHESSTLSAREPIKQKQIFVGNRYAGTRVKIWIPENFNYSTRPPPSHRAKR